MLRLVKFSALALAAIVLFGSESAQAQSLRGSYYGSGRLCECGENFCTCPPGACAAGDCDPWCDACSDGCGTSLGRCGTMRPLPYRPAASRYDWNTTGYRAPFVRTGASHYRYDDFRAPSRYGSNLRYSTGRLNDLYEDCPRYGW